jgi:hypothetical protein
MENTMRSNVVELEMKTNLFGGDRQESIVYSTFDYDKFKFRDDTKSRVTPGGLAKLKESISSKNLLSQCPILVSPEMYILDGQHRTIVAKELGLRLYYTIHNENDFMDIIYLQTRKNWSLETTLDFYCMNGYSDYIKFKDFVKKTKVPISAGLRLFIGGNRNAGLSFRFGKLKFDDKIILADFEKLKDVSVTVESFCINGKYARGMKFLLAALAAIRSEGYDHDKMITHIKMLSGRISLKSSQFDYLKQFEYVFNFKSKNKVKFTVIEESE